MEHTPSYIGLYKNGKLKKLVDSFRKKYQTCNICPHKCNINRYESNKGVCNTNANAMVSSASTHRGEEPPLVGKNGSGTIFFTGCNMKCSYCQNHEISHLMYGSEISSSELATLMIKLQNEGNHNINFVSPSHMLLQILEALEIAIEMGLNIPLVYNSGGYDSVETLKAIKGVFDIYMPDIKYSSNDTAWELSKIKDYKKISQAAVKEMYRQVGNLQINKQGVAYKGLLIRHLMLPGYPDESKNIIDFITNLSKDTYFNLMNQYRPNWHAYNIELLNRQIGMDEYNELKEYALRKGLYRFG